MFAAFLISRPGLTDVVELSDRFEGESDLTWITPIGGPATAVPASGEPRLTPSPATGEHVMRVTTDGSTNGLNCVLAGEAAQNMTVRAWVFCEGNDGGVPRGGYQGILARASHVGGSQHMIRLAWDPDRRETSDTGDGWVKLQAYDGATWDYLGIDPADFGATERGYILNGTAWPSGWHLFGLEVSGERVAAFVDDMETPVAEGRLSISLRDGHAGLYVYTAGDWAGYFDDFSAAVDVPPPPPPADFDVLILNGTVIADGDTPPAPLDVGIIGDRIAAIEPDLTGFTASRIIDATDRLVVPGFIDAHTHADGGGGSGYTLQGVTTIVAGNCGESRGVGAMAVHLAGLEGRIAANHVTLVGHNTLRSHAGLSGSTPTPTQMQIMCDTLAAAMEDGAFGLSTGLIYATGFNSSTEEIIELANVVARHGGIYASHIRGEGETVLSAVAEAIEICRASGAPTQISHVKCAGPAAWHLSDEYLGLVDAALAGGLPIMMDQYPYTASQAHIDVLFPSWALNDWSDAVTNHRPELEEDVRALIAGRGGADRIHMISGPFAGQWLDDAATARGKDPEDLLIDDIGPGGASAIYHTMLEEDVRVFMQHPRVMMGSDGPTGAHPRGQGTFARIWGHYGRELGLFDWQELVSKTSTLAARQFLLDRQRRGSLREGWYADLVVLNPATIIDRATFENPGTMPIGIDWVFVNGQLAAESGSARSTTAGRPLHLQDSSVPVGLVLLGQD